LAEKIGVSTTTIQSYESTTLPRGEHLVNLCKALQCSADYLLFGFESSNIKTVGFDEFDMVPMAEARLGAGGGLVVLSERLKDFYAFRKEWLHRIVTSVANAVLMRIQGDSMEPFIRDGDTVMVDQGRREIATGKIFALGVDDTVLLKRLEIHPAGRIIIKSDNPAYSTYELAPSEIRVIGQVVWSAHEHVRLD
jgi:phage repressor protein C with HTH and peptisase S24 domain